jgi:hypothetical protein
MAHFEMKGYREAEDEFNEAVERDRSGDIYRPYEEQAKATRLWKQRTADRGFFPS